MWGINVLREKRFGGSVLGRKSVLGNKYIKRLGEKDAFLGKNVFEKKMRFWEKASVIMKKYVGIVFQNKSVKNYFLKREAFNLKANFLLIENIFFFREVFFQIKVIFTKKILDVSNTKKL